MISLNIIGRMDDSDELQVSCHARIQRGGGDGGGQGIRTPLKNHKNIGFLSNTCWDPIKFTKLNVGPSSARQRNTI